MLVERHSPPLLETGYSFGGVLDGIPHIAEGMSSSISAICRNSDELWMREAIRHSMSNAGAARPNPSVGCVIVKNGQTISAGATEPYGGRHAERVALCRAIDDCDLRNATAYVTLEPCTHYGHQPPCVDILEQSPLARVVIAASDPNPLVNGRGIARLRANGKQVTTGVLCAESIAFNFPFHVRHRMGRPLFAMAFKRTDPGCESKSSSCRATDQGEARAYLRWMLPRYDSILTTGNALISRRSSLRDFTLSDGTDARMAYIILDYNGIVLSERYIDRKSLERWFGSRPRAVVLISTAAALREADRTRIRWLEAGLGFVIAATDSDDISKNEIMCAIRSPTVTKSIGREIQSVFIDDDASITEPCLLGCVPDLLHVFSERIGGEEESEEPTIARTPQVCGRREAYMVVAEANIGESVLTEMVLTEVCNAAFLS